MSVVKIAVLGGGAWGTALSLALLRAGNEPLLWARDPHIVDAVNRRHENPRYLPGIRLDDELRATTDLAAALTDAECVLLVAPAQVLRTLCEQVARHVATNTPLVICAKGIEATTGMLLSEIVGEIMPSNPVAALSGPSFAADVSRGLPTAVTVAARDGALAAHLAALLSAPHLRCYSSTDLAGVEIGGALKNVMAIAAGAASGAELGASAQAALVTRGFVELRRLDAAFGARPETLMGLSGLGDLILSCGSARSRNFAYGVALGRGESLEGLPLAEGVATAGIAARLACERGIDAPIVDAVSSILAGRITVPEAISALLSRPLKSEDA